MQTAYGSEVAQPVLTLGFEPTNVRCPHCAQMVTTRVAYQTGTCAWITVVALVFMCVDLRNL